jgi:hypothetical protein
MLVVLACGFFVIHFDYGPIGDIAAGVERAVVKLH